MRRLLLTYLTNLFIVLSTALPVVGQTEELHDVLNLRDGLAESRIRRLTEMPDGKLVVATAGVVSIYDGTRFYPYHLLPKNTHPLPDYRTYRNLMCDTDGRIWMLNTGELHVIIPQAEGYVANVDSVLHSIGWQGDSINNFYLDNTLVAGKMCSRYWMITRQRELYCCEHGHCRRIIGLDELDHGIPERILSAENTAYLCYHTGHIYRLQWKSEDKSHTLSVKTTFYGTPLKEEFISRTRHGIETMLFDGKLWLTLNLQDERHSYIARLDTAKGEWLPNIALLMRISMCASSPDSLLYVVGNRGIYVLSANGQIQEHRRLLPVTDTGVADTLKEDVSSILFDRFGSLWIGTSENGLLHYRLNRRNLIKMSEEPYPHQPTKPFCSERAKSMAERFASGSTNCSYEDAEGTIYLGTRKGLVVISPKDELVTCLDEKDGLTSVNIQAMVAQGDSLLWLSTTTGISRIAVHDNNCFELMHYGKLDGLNTGGRELKVGEMCLNEADSTICVGFGGGRFFFSPKKLAQSSRFVFHHVARAWKEETVQSFNTTATVVLTCILLAVIILRLGYYLYKRRDIGFLLPKELSDEETMQPSEESKNASTPNLSDDDRLFLGKLQHLTKQHIGNENFTVQSLASAMAMDRTVLFRRMQQLMNLSPSAYIRKERMEEAARLLRETETPINEIASHTGFPDVKYFGRIFKNTFGISPREYRTKSTI